LLEHGFGAAKDLEAAEAAYISALAERDRAAARLNNYGGSDLPGTELERAAGDRLEAKIASFAGNDAAKNARYVLRTPLSGVVVDKSINPGQEVRADMMLANAGSLDALAASRRGGIGSPCASSGPSVEDHLQGIPEQNL
jgi:cobalt-zinc-cadmium efflux system membrane fusion protein